jgi:predicted RNase H-like HicB family nuclease
MAVQIPKSAQFRACIYPSSDKKGYVAHCLETDLIGEGKTPKKAIIELIEAIEIQIKACDNPSQFFFFAPEAVWQKYNKSSGRVILRRIVTDAFRQIATYGYVPNFERVVATSAVPKQYVQVE